MAEIWPTISERPVELHSLVSEKLVKTSFAVRCGARHHRVMTTARKARTWRTMKPFCSLGHSS